MSSEWFYTKGGSPFGPVSEAILKQLAKAGEFGPKDFVRNENQEDWVPASKIAGLFETDHEISAEDESKAKIELDAASLFFFSRPMGFVNWLIFLAAGTLILDYFLIAKDKPDEPFPRELIMIMDGIVVVFGLCIYFGMKRSLGKDTACPHCGAWFSRLLIKSDARVVNSREEVRTYTTQVAIRDKNHRVTGYLDQERTLPVTVKTVHANRKYRCKSCQRRWESTEVGTVNS